MFRTRDVRRAASIAAALVTIVVVVAAPAAAGDPEDRDACNQPDTPAETRMGWHLEKTEKSTIGTSTEKHYRTAGMNSPDATTNMELESEVKGTQTVTWSYTSGKGETYSNEANWALFKAALENTWHRDVTQQETTAEEVGQRTKVEVEPGRARELFWGFKTIGISGDWYYRYADCRRTMYDTTTITAPFFEGWLSPYTKTSADSGIAAADLAVVAAGDVLTIAGTDLVVPEDTTTVDHAVEVALGEGVWLVGEGHYYLESVSDVLDQPVPTPGEVTAIIGRETTVTVPTLDDVTEGLSNALTVPPVPDLPPMYVQTSPIL